MIWKDVPGRIGSKMGVGSGCRSVLIRRVRNIRSFYPTVFIGTAENIIKKEFLELPDSVLFNIFVLPYSSTDYCPKFATTI
jgi:hypothetical protein